MAVSAIDGIEFVLSIRDLASAVIGKSAAGIETAITSIDFGLNKFATSAENSTKVTQEAVTAIIAGLRDQGISLEDFLSDMSGVIAISTGNTQLELMKIQARITDLYPNLNITASNAKKVADEMTGMGKAAVFSIPKIKGLGSLIEGLKFGTGFAIAIEAVKELVNIIGTTLGPALTVLRDNFLAIFSPLIPVFVDFARLITSFLQSVIGPFINDLVQFARGLLDALRGTGDVTDGIRVAAEAIQESLEAMKPVFETIFDTIKMLLPAIVALTGEIFKLIAALAPGFIRVFSVALWILFKAVEGVVWILTKVINAVTWLLETFPTLSKIVGVFVGVILALNAAGWAYNAAFVVAAGATESYAAATLRAVGASVMLKWEWIKGLIPNAIRVASAIAGTTVGLLRYVFASNAATTATGLQTKSWIVAQAQAIPNFIRGLFGMTAATGAQTAASIVAAEVDVGRIPIVAGLSLATLKSVAASEAAALAKSKEIATTEVLTFGTLTLTTAKNRENKASYMSAVANTEAAAAKIFGTGATTGLTIATNAQTKATWSLTNAMFKVPIIGWIAAGITLIAVVLEIAHHFGRLTTVLKLWGLGLAVMFAPLLIAIAPLLVGGYLLYKLFSKLEAKTQIFSKLWAGLGVVFDIVGSILEGVVNTLANLADLITDLPLGWLTSLFGGEDSTVTVESSTVPVMAEGGVVTQATLAQIGESGPEAVIPLDKLIDILPDFSGGLGFLGSMLGDTMTDLFMPGSGKPKTVPPTEAEKKMLTVLMSIDAKLGQLLDQGGDNPEISDLGRG